MCKGKSKSSEPEDRRSRRLKLVMHSLLSGLLVLELAKQLDDTLLAI